MPSYDVSGPIELDVTAGVAFVDVVASDRGDTVVEIGPSTPGRGGDESLARDSTVTFDDGRVRVRVPRRLNLFSKGDSVDVRCEVPTGSRVEIENTYGSVRTRGVLGDARIVAKYGSVTADTVGDLVLEAAYGSIDIAAVSGRLDVTGGHGAIRIAAVHGEARLRAAHGTTELGTAGGDVEATTSGPLTVERALGDVTARSAHGPIRVREVTGGTIRLDNGHADIDVGVPAGVAAWIDASSAHGRVRNELTPDPAAAESERTVELHLHAGYGNVIIRRVTTPRREAPQ
ncbi:DUF4097 family beta strand repeat-containing protein [Dactylosporangium matsuzakiense]|uniref:Adhesin n=1 Tax=Dactylosporangium matsuzakiense TaxID=53360 RepID=A0A9W6KQJ8_9ACTN|nr:hypothetical protein [Dactylosporangium matsuzakiense]UWZ48397.1 hypothetical protein Dmats_19485 [Dactylosporangium matsuzakiense]GLL05448.1 hypothetical protein GCM10017581_071950 [Dactylosporangium matsuzakiense]